MRIQKYLFVLIFALTVSAAGGQVATPPEVQPLGKVDFPKYEKKVLPNGLTVYAVEHREQPVVSIRLAIAAGAVNEAPESAGLASITADMLTRGTSTRSATDIAEAIDMVGGSLSASADMESTTLASGVLTDSVDLAFELMADVLLNPVFDETEIGRLQQEAMSGLIGAMEDPDYLADAVLDRVIYGAHPYGHVTGGTLESIPRIRRPDLVGFHQTYYAPNISAVVIAGDLSPAEAFEKAEKWFGAWEQKDVPTATMASAPKTESRRIIVIDKPDAVQTEIRVGQTTVSRKDTDYFPVLVTSYVLGGSASGRLNQTLRVDRGLTYGAYSTIKPRKGPGMIYSITDTRTEKTSEALQLIFDEIGKIRNTAVPAPELQNAKNFIVGSFPLSIELPTDLASRLTTVFLYELGDDYLNTFRDRIASVSVADVQRIARERITPDNMVVVLVGNAAEFLETVKPFGAVEVIGIAELTLDNPTLKSVE